MLELFVTQSPILIVLCPLLAAILVGLFGFVKPKLTFPIIVLGAFSSFLASICTLTRVIQSGPLSYYLGNWAPPFGIEYRIDHLNALVLVVITFVALISLVYSYRFVQRDFPDKITAYYCLFSLLITGLTGMTITGDVFNIYVLLEVSALSTYALLAMGNKQSFVATFNYVIIGTIGASFYLLGVAYFLLKTGSLNMADISLKIAALQGSQALMVGVIFVLMGMWIKMAFFPFHGWLPNAYSFAPSSSICLIAPLMTKVSVYIMVRIMYTVLGTTYIFQTLSWHTGVVTWASIAIIVGSIYALMQTDLRKTLSYIIIAEVGYMVGGAWLGNAAGLTGTIYHIMSDALMTLSLFMVAGCILYKTGTVSLRSFEGMFHKMPFTMTAFIVSWLAVIGIPPFCGFFSKWYLISGGFEANAYLYVAALIFSSFVNAILCFKWVEKSFFASHTHPVSMDEAPLSLLIPTLGISVTLLVVGLSTGPIITRIISLAIPASFGGL